jgi:hypothetical protein
MIMDSSTTSIFVFGIYLIFVGTGFLLIPYKKRSTCVIGFVDIEYGK